MAGSKKHDVGASMKEEKQKKEVVLQSLQEVLHFCGSDVRSK